MINNILILSTEFHYKNKIGLENMLNYFKCHYKFGDIHEINNFDIIYSPCIPINTSNYSDKKFIFGPQFSVFPEDSQMNIIENVYNNCIYIQPSEWVVNLWSSFNVEKWLPLKSFPFPVDTIKFCPLDNERNKVFIYFKRRKPDELNCVENLLKSNKIEYIIFDYVNKYDENDYLHYLQESKYGIILDAHESQGFAIEEALSCNVPLLVWNTKYMSQEYGSSYADYPCTTIPYWDDRCGEFFYNENELEKTFNIFIDKLNTYNPRQYILDNLSVDKCAENFINLCK